MSNKWFKFYGGDYLSDPKIERLTPIERSCWITLLCMASMGDDGIIKYLTCESLLNRSGIYFDPYHPDDWEKAITVLNKFQNMKMIELYDDGDIKIVNWEKRQEHNLTPAERMAKMRLLKAKSKDVTVNVTDVTLDKNRIDKNIINTLSQSDVPFSFEEEIQKLSTSNNKLHKIIAHYWISKDFKFDNKKQFNASLRRELRPAKALEGYNSEEVTRSINYCKAEYKVWTLETVGKRISDLVNKK